jgi:large subunit ribosomal protein L6
MAGIGSWPVPIPEKVKVSVQNGRVSVQGAKGQLEMSVDPSIAVQVTASNITVARSEDSRRVKAIHGMTRKMIANMVEGVSKGFTRTVEISGVGYRAEAVGKSAIQFTLGYSHPIMYQLPPGVQAKIDRQTVVTLEGIDKQLLGEVTVGIRRLRPPDPYKAKGVKLAGETIRKKAGKTAGAR